jgi:hypothetical protein
VNSMVDLRSTKMREITLVTGAMKTWTTGGSETPSKTTTRFSATFRLPALKKCAPRGRTSRLVRQQRLGLNMLVGKLRPPAEGLSRGWRELSTLGTNRKQLKERWIADVMWFWDWYLHTTICMCGISIE